MDSKYFFESSDSYQSISVDSSGPAKKDKVDKEIDQMLVDALSSEPVAHALKECTIVRNRKLYDKSIVKDVLCDLNNI